MFQVNFSPALAADCQNDLTVKKTMLNDLMDMLNFSDEDRERGGESPERQMHKAYSSSYSPKTLSHLGGGRRHSYAPNDRNVRMQTTRGTKYGRKKCTTMMLANKLPRIPRRTKAGEDVDGYCEYCGEGDDNDDDDGEDDSDNVEVIPIVPGCGLPSVQQPPVPLTCKSSANIGPCSHGDSHEDGALKSCSSGHLPEGKGCGRKSSTDHRGKNSLKSDSGISSHSASSENSDECKHTSQFSRRKLRSQTTTNASQMRQSVSDVKVALDGGVMSKKPQSENRGKVRSSLRQLSEESQRRRGNRRQQKCSLSTRFAFRKVLHLHNAVDRHSDAGRREPQRTYGRRGGIVVSEELPLL